MRRLLAVLVCALTMTMVVASPALALYHDKIANPLLHALADLATVTAVCLPVLYLAVRARTRTARG